MSDGVAVGVFSYFISEDAKDEYDAQVHLGTSTSTLQATCQYVVHTRLTRFLTYDVLHVAHNVESHDKQGATEVEMQFAQRTNILLASSEAW